MGVQARSDITQKRYFLESDHKYKRETVAQNGTASTAATITDVATYPVDIDGLTMGITVNDGSGEDWDGVEQTVTGAADGQTVAEVAQLFNESLDGVKAVVTGGHIVLTTDGKGLDATIQVTDEGDMNAVMAFPTTLAQGDGIDAGGLEMFTVMVRNPSNSSKLQPMTALNSAAGLSEPAGLLGVALSAAEWAAGDVENVPLVVQADLVNEDLVVLKNSLALDDVITGTTNYSPNITIRHALQKMGIYMSKTLETMGYENA